MFAACARGGRVLVGGGGQHTRITSHVTPFTHAHTHAGVDSTGVFCSLSLSLYVKSQKEPTQR